jgi:hypothetical protein
VPGEDPPLRVEAVREGAQTQVTRLYFPGRTVIRKQLLGPDAERRLRREVGILQRLRGVEGVTQLVDRPRYGDSLVLADAGSTTLAALATPDNTGPAGGGPPPHLGTPGRSRTGHTTDDGGDSSGSGHPAAATSPTPAVEHTPGPQHGRGADQTTTQPTTDTPTTTRAVWGWKAGCSSVAAWPPR